MEAETENLGTPTFIDTKLFLGLQALMQPEDLTVLLCCCRATCCYFCSGKGNFHHLLKYFYTRFFHHLLLNDHKNSSSDEEKKLPLSIEIKKKKNLKSCLKPNSCVCLGIND